MELDENVTGVELRITGTSLSGIIGRLSTDGGVTWTRIYGISASLNFTPGRKLKIEIILASANTQVDSVALLYR